MTGDETGPQRLARMLRDQGAGCTLLGSPLYGALFEHAAADVLAGGPTAAVLAGYEASAFRDAVPLRMMGGVHALALQGEAPAVAAYYPSTGGERDPGPGAADAWRAVRDLLDERQEAVRAWLQRPPQTNEVGRASALLGGLRHLCAATALPVRLVEIGTSAGLNLRADRFRVDGAAGTFGRPDAPVRLREGWQGRPVPAAPVKVVSREGGDLDPIDPTSDDGRLTLTAYVWPDQVERMQRLRGALRLAAEVPATVRRESALQTVSRLRPQPGHWTVLWHSVMWQYVDRDQQAAVLEQLDVVGAAATGDAPVAHLSLEPARRSPDHDIEFLVSLRVWPGGERRLLGTAAPHGIPTTWE